MWALRRNSLANVLLSIDRALDLARFTVQTFILHASVVKQLGEIGKLKLTSDTTSLEFAVSQYLSSHGLSLASMGDQFKALRGAFGALHSSSRFTH